MDKDLLRTLIPALVSGHLPRGTRNFRYQAYDNTPLVSSFGIRVDPLPFQGTIIAKTDEAMLIKTGRISFAAVDRALASLDPAEGTRVEVTPYARRRFDGLRADTPKQETQQMEDGRTYTVHTVMLGGNSVHLPLPKPRCPELADLFEQIENLPAPDGIRSIVNLLVDANACNFTCVDPVPEAIIDMPPTISFDVSTGKFSGRVSVIYDRALDVYVVEFMRGEEWMERVDEVYFDSLGQTLAQRIDDGTWRRIQVSVIGREKLARH
jgi:hypothetical protein